MNNHNTFSPLSKIPNDRLFAMALVSLFLQSTPALYAQQVPNAGVLERGAEQSFKVLPPRQLKSQGWSTPDWTPPKEGEVSVVVRGFEFEGNQKISSALLNAQLEPFLNKPLSFEQLKRASDVVMNAYRQAGWMVRAFLPKQEIEGGLVKISIIEGVFGGTQVDGSLPQRVLVEQLIQMGNAANPLGEAVRAVQLDRALLLMDDLPGVVVTGNLVQGEQAGQTKLSVQALDGPLMDASLSSDNSGSLSTGAARLMLSANLNSPAKRGDLLSANLLKSEGSNYARLNYAMPLGALGWRAGVHASALNYSLIGPFSALGANGTAYTHGLNADYPLIRSLVYNLNFSANWDHKWYLNQANQSVTSKYQMQVGSWLLNGQALDNWLSGGVTTYSLAYTQGRVNLSDSPNELTDAQTVQTAGDFNKSNFNISRLQTLTPSLGLLLNFNAQRANKNLDSSEKIYLGGATGVRAYPSNEGGGSEGQTMSLELRQRIADVWTLSGFYDYGHVRIYPNNQDVLGAPLTGLNQFALRGAGLSVAWQAAPGVDFKLSVARRILDNPMANAKTGADSDGTLRLNRVWFNAALAF